jgi:4-amino-4-deoxy-L-arabinose transferase-like glycosyltransferase
VATAVLAPSWLRVSSRRFVGLVAGAVALVRLLTLVGPLHPDEAGYLLVAQGWRSGGPNLYGHYFVDRPPLLIALYRVAVMTGWPSTIRVLASISAVLFVVAAAWAARQVVGDRGVRWAALAAGALVTTPLLMAQEADGEIFAAPLVMVAVALTLAAVRRGGGRSFVLAVGAGVAAGCAVMVKQNFVDALVFAVTLLVVGVHQRLVNRGTAARVASGGVLGGMLVVAGALAYVAWSRVGLSVAWTAVFGFRGTALDVIEDHSLHAPMVRAVELVGLGVLTGVLPLVVVLLLEAVRSRLRGSPVAWAVGVTLVVEVAAMASGGSYWPHYLLQLAPMVALAAGLWAEDASRVRAAVAFVVASSVAATAVTVLTGAASGHTGQAVGTWLSESARSGDTATVLYGNADVQQASGMTSPYPQLWTLPMRTLDPHLADLRTVLRGRHGPTWVVAWGNLDPWHIDAHHRTAHALTTHYRQVAQVCGHPVYLRQGVHRTLAPSTCRSESGIDIDLP